jgi:hypothetical protein
MEPAVTISSPIVLATGRVTRADMLRVELHRPIDSPSFVLVVWPTGPSVANPKALANIAAALVRLMAEAQAQLATIRTER